MPEDVRTVVVLPPPTLPPAPPLIWRPGKEVLERFVYRLCSLMEAYPRPLYSHVLEGVTKNWAAFREDPLTEARAWSRHVSYICIPIPSTLTSWRESPRTGPPSERTPSQRPGPGPGMYPIYVSPPSLILACIPYRYLYVSPPPLLARTGGSHLELGLV